MNSNIQDFISEVHANDALRKELQVAGRSVTDVEAKALKHDIANELVRVASRYGYTLHVDDFYQHGDMSWLSSPGE